MALASHIEGYQSIWRAQGVVCSCRLPCFHPNRLDLPCFTAETPFSNRIRSARSLFEELGPKDCLLFEVDRSDSRCSNSDRLDDMLALHEYQAGVGCRAPLLLPLDDLRAWIRSDTSHIVYVWGRGCENVFVDASLHVVESNIHIQSYT